MTITKANTQIQQWTHLAQQLRVDSIRCTTAAGSGHPTSSMSAADLMSVLMLSYLRYDFDDPQNPNNDHLIFSKGHASPLLYSMFKAAGAIADEEFMTLRKFGSRLEGHPTPRLPWVDVATGSLGQGLPVGVGVGLAGRYLDRLPYRVWVLCGDGELAEGSMWEAFEHAAFTQLDNLTAILDINRLGQTGPTRHGWDTGAYAERLRAFGWHAIEIDGHDVDAIDKAYQEAVGTAGRPTAIVARTVKGKGVKAVENRNGMHGKPLDDPEGGIRELAERGVRARVIDCYSVKPIDQVTLHTAAEATSRIVTVEDHWPEGGLGDAVLDAFADSRPFPRVVKLAVSGMPGSGKPAELLRQAGIDADAIADAALALAEVDR